METLKEDEDIDAINSGIRRQFCTFWLSGRLFGVDILDVKEINPELTFTPIYHAPREVKGYVNIRGQIYLVIDLRMLLGFEGKEIDKDNCVVIFKNRVAESFGVLVDKIGDVVEVTGDQIEERLKSGEVSDDLEGKTNIDGFIECICKLQGNLLVILKPGNFLKAI